MTFFKKHKTYHAAVIILFSFGSLLFAQHLELIDNRVTAVHNGNLIRTRFTNYGILGHRYEKPLQLYRNCQRGGVLQPAIRAERV